MYKIGDGKTVVPNNGTFDDTGGRFNPGNFTGGFNPQNNLTNNAEVAGLYLKDYTNHSKNIESILKALSVEMEVKIKLDLEHFWSFIPDVFNEYVNIFEVPHKEIFKQYLIDKLKQYEISILNDKIDLLTNLEKNTVKLGGIVNGLSVVLDGYDLNTDETRTYRYEVIPNGYKLNSDTNKLFGYDPYYQYKTSSFNNFQIITLKTARDIIYNTELNNVNKLKFLSLGNGTYFFKQITKDNIIKKISGNNYTFDNNLPESIAINNQLIPTPLLISPNFIVTNGITLNTKLDKNGFTNGETTTLTIQPTGNENTTDSYKRGYKMKYTFEKLNYEFFDFSNKVLDVMLNDNFMSKAFDMDINFDGNKDFLTQLLNLQQSNPEEPLSFTEWLDVNNITIVEGSEQEINNQYQQYVNGFERPEQLFYSGKNKTLENIPIGYYLFNIGSVSGTITESKVIAIDNFIKYDFTLTKNFILNSTKPSLIDLTNSKINMTGLIDLLFIKIFSDLKETDKIEILNRITKQTPKTGIGDDQKTKDSKIFLRKRKIEKILDKIFIGIGTYVTEANKVLKPLHTDYSNNERIVVKKINKILVDDEIYAEFNPEFIGQKLIKGGVKDYTLVIKDTNEVLSSAINNYIPFTNTRGLLNIVTQSEQPEVIEDKTPKWSKDTVYIKDEFVEDEGVIYVALITSEFNNTLGRAEENKDKKPKTNPNFWAEAKTELTKYLKTK